MIEFKRKITYWNGDYMQWNWAKHNKLGTMCYDQYGKRWEVLQDIHFDKFWAREIKDKEPELVVKGFRKDD